MKKTCTGYWLLFLLSFGLGKAKAQCSKATLAYQEFLKFDYCSSSERVPPASYAHSLMLKLCRFDSQVSLEQLEGLAGGERCDSALNLVLSGYDSLYNRPMSLGALKNFMGAYDLSRTAKDELHKLVLLSLLEFYEDLLYSDHQNFSRYLQEFGELAETNVEKFWALYYESAFWGKSTLEVAWKHLARITSEMENLLSKMDPSSNLQLLGRSNFAMIKKHEGELDTAFKEQLYIFESCKAIPFLEHLAIRACHHIAMIKTEQREYDEALKYVDVMNEFVDGSDSIDVLFAVNRRKAIIFQELGQYRKALNYLQIANSYETKSKYQSTGRYASSLETQLRTLQQERDILEKDVELKSAKRKNATYIGISLFFALIALFIYNRLHVNRLEKEQYLVALENEQQRNQLNAVNARIDGEEAQRLEVAEFLHDHVSGSLAAMKIHIDLGLKNSEASLKKARKLIDEISLDIRHLAYDLFPTVLLKRDFIGALEQLSDSYSSKNLQVNVINNTEIEIPSSKVRIRLYFAVKELLNNVLRHSGASHAEVFLFKEGDHFVLQVSDDGRGFRDYKARGSGLSMIESRIATLGGSLLIDGGKGSQVSLHIPMDKLHPKSILSH